MSALHLRINVIRRVAKRLAAVAEGRAVQAESARPAPSFRPLAEAEAEAFVGGELLASLTAVFRVPDRGSGNPTPLGGMGSRQ